MALKLRHYHTALGIKGVVLFLCSKITGFKPVVRVKVRGLAHPVRLRIGTTDISTYQQVLVQRQYAFDKPAAPRFIIDAGANIGLSAVYFANQYPLAKIVALEPEASNFRMLCVNVMPYPQVIPIRAALWRENMDLFLFDSGHGNHGFQVGANDARDRSRIGSVPGLTIAAILHEAGETQVDLLKVDIEGAEREVMEDSAGWIDKVGVFMIELHDEIKSGCSQAFHDATHGFSKDVTKGETIMRCAVAADPAATPE
ncbi:MAG: FkbM family methyltransferase [Verrucomicrobiota bacterium]